MARKSKINTQTLILLISQFLTEECDNDASMLKIPEIGSYIRSKGYDISDYLIRRNEDAREYIRSLQKDTKHAYMNHVSVYRDMDIDAFLTKNNTKERLVRALKEREGYFKEVAVSAAHAFKQNKSLQNKIIELESQVATLQKETTGIQDKNSSLSTGIKDCQAENKKLRDIIDTYDYPEIANELLRQQGLLKNTANIVNPDKIADHLITADTNVSPIKNSIVKGLFDKV